MSTGLRRRACGWFISAAVLILLTAPSRAQVAAPEAHSLTQPDLQAWTDGLLPFALAQAGVPGAVVSVVKDGSILFEKGYGYADIVRHLPMDPARTLIRPGSISKTFTWTAMIQLVEQKRLDLDADVNTYLDFHVPAYHGQKLTLREIAAHRSGFAEEIKDLGDSKPAENLETYVKRHLPPRIYPPGAVPAYSNYAAALAGYIVARVSGEDYADYVARHIFAPLDMSHSTFAQPVPAAWRDALSEGYRAAGKPPGYFEFIALYPAGGLTSTADDMARFMLGQLQHGAGAGGRFLSEAGASLLQASQDRIFPALNAMAMGFYETSRNGHRVIGHNGATQFFHSDLHLFTNDGVGLFISMNGTDDEESTARIENALFEGFADRYFPRTSPLAAATVPADTARAHARAMSGLWESAQQSSGTWLSLAGIFGSFRLDTDGSGQIVFRFPGRGILHWSEITPWLWRNDAGDKMQASLRNGRPAMLGFDVAPPISLLPVPWWCSFAWITPALILAIAVLLLDGLSLPVVAGRRVLRSAGTISPAPDTPRTAARLVHGALALALIAYPVLLASFSQDFTLLSGRTDRVLYGLEAVTLALLAGASWLAALDWRRAWRPRAGWRRVAGKMARAMALGVAWWVAIVFNLVNFNLNY